MLISYSWLKEFVSLRKSAERVASDLSLVSVGVEGIRKIGSDKVLDIDITYNRGDLLSVVGVARELAAIYELPLKGLVEKFQPVEHLSPLPVKNNVSLSKLYTLTKISELKYKVTPKQIKSRLEAAGMRSVNLWADLTNYMMLEWGQPFRAFDAERVGRRDSSLPIEIRSAKRGEKIKTLDGLDRELIEGDIVIADKAGAIAVAGVMGGEDTEVDEGTTEILLEGAIFDPISIRKTARRLGLRSEASNRFEHYLSPDNLYISLNKILQLYQFYGKGKITGFVSVGERNIEPYSVGLTHDKLTRGAGEALPRSKARLYLERLGFKVMSSEKGLLCWPPNFRGDIRIPEDVAEEVLRLHGYEKILSKPIQTTLEEVRENRQEDWRDRVTSGLTGNGFSEIKTFPFVSTAALTHLKTKDLLRLKNPISVEAEYLRPSLLLPLLEVAKRNSPRSGRGRVFELEKVYPKRGENLALGALIWGEEEPFLGLKGVLEELGRQAHLRLEFSPVKEEFLHPVKAVEVRAGRERIGVLGEVHPHLTTAFDITVTAAIKTQSNKRHTSNLTLRPLPPIPAYPE